MGAGERSGHVLWCLALIIIVWGSRTLRAHSPKGSRVCETEQVDILNLNSTTDCHLFKALWDSIENHDQSISEFFCSRQSSQQYTSLRTELKEDDHTIEQVTRFRDDIWSLTIARRLNLISQWSLRYHKSLAHGIRVNGNIFVADKKLWA